MSGLEPVAFTSSDIAHIACLRSWRVPLLHLNGKQQQEENCSYTSVGMMFRFLRLQLCVVEQGSALRNKIIVFIASRFTGLKRGSDFLKSLHKFTGS
jgi:hypothetical protein